MKARFLEKVVVTVLAVLGQLTIANAQMAKEIAQKSFPSVVLLVMEDRAGQPLQLGSGFFVQDGIVATCYHVVEGAARGYAKMVGQKTKLDIRGIVGLDERHDLALLSVSEANVPSLSIGDIKNVSVGDEVYVVSNPMGLEGTLSQGIVGGIRHVNSDTIFQITAPVSPGSSGGPVLNSKQEVIGVAAATLQGGQNLNFAIPSSYLSALLKNLRPPTPLSLNTKTPHQNSILNEFGERSVKGISGEAFTWEGITLGDFTFSLRNYLREPVRDIAVLIIFYDEKGNPIDTFRKTYCPSAYLFFDETAKSIIPGGLAKRVKGRVDPSVRRLSNKVEIRILDFRIALEE